MRRLLDLAAEFGLWPTWGLRWRIRNRWRYPTAGSLWSRLLARTGSGQRYWHSQGWP